MYHINKVLDETHDLYPILFLNKSLESSIAMPVLCVWWLVAEKFCIAVMECFTFHSTPDILASSFLHLPNAPASVNHSEYVLPFSLLSENDLEQVFQMFTWT